MLDYPNEAAVIRLFDYHLVTPLRPSPEVPSWERHCRIKYPKAMERGAAHG